MKEKRNIERGFKKKKSRVKSKKKVTPLSKKEMAFVNEKFEGIMSGIEQVRKGKAFKTFNEFLDELEGEKIY